jgi:uncharacterized protein YebE (UPF0316 family)
MEKLLTELGVWSYLIIFVAKIIEVAIATIRIMFVAKGEKLKASFIAFIEITIWIIIVSTVLNGINEDPIRAVVYCAAFAIGNYIGVSIESKLALGLSSVQAIIKEGTGEELIEALRENGFGLTIIKGEGKENKKEILQIHLKRRRIKEAVDIIKQNKEDAVIIINEVKSVSGGFMKK